MRYPPKRHVRRDDESLGVAHVLRLRAKRDSSDLGVARGMAVLVTGYRAGNKMDLYVPALDADIAGVPVNHPDLEIA
jgi:hypothetical protein